MNKKMAFVGAVLAFALAGSIADAQPDPIGDRAKPTLKSRNPAPAPAPPRSSGDDARGAKIGSRNAASDGDGTAVSAAEDTGGGIAPIGSDAGYRLGPQDILKIEVWNRAEVEYDWRTATVTGQGTIFLPLLDDVAVDGLTIPEVTERLTKLYDDYIIGSQVYVEIQEFNSRQVSVVGEVKNPGRYPLRGAVSLTELLAAAGDLTKHASNVVRVIREDTESGQPIIMDIDIGRIQTGDPRDNIRIQPNDQVYVLVNKNIVYVTGMVATEGYVDWEEGMTGQQAVILAGGFAEGSAAGRTKIYRVDGESTRQFKVDLKDQRKPIKVLPGDIIYVPRSWL